MSDKPEKKFFEDPPPKTHPIWGIFRMTIMLFFMTIVLRLTASSFDSTEVMALIAMIFGLGGVDTWIKKMQGKGK